VPSEKDLQHLIFLEGKNGPTNNIVHLLPPEKDGENQRGTEKILQSNPRNHWRNG
jgi:hypothetical protein